jgi:mono/diheme cytochrome c family protein
MPLWPAGLLVFLCLPAAAAADAPVAGIAAAQSLLARYCIDCHSSDSAEGEVDLSFTRDAAAFGRHGKLVQRVEEMVASGQMPPPDSDQPTDEERQALADWLRAFLTAEARAHAGDPGRVVLRRLNNAEYTHTIRDLTGVDSLDPVREFPADGGAGEGFTNTGQSLVMSPSLATKYLDATKGIAAHAVLLPDGIGFSASTERQDWIDDILAKIRGLYSRYTAAGSNGFSVEQGLKLTLGDGGRLPVDRYLAAVQGGASARAAPALSAKYLTILRAALESKSLSPILDPLRAKFRAGGLQAADIAAWQAALWRFEKVGHIGKLGGPKAWQTPIDPVVTTHEIRLPLKAPKEGEAVTVYLVVRDAGDGRDGDVVVWKNPRLVARGRADVPLVDLREAGLDPAMFGRGPDGLELGPGDLCTAAPAVIEFRVPESLLGEDAAFVATARLLDPSADGSVQTAALTARPAELTGLVPPVAAVSRGGGDWSDHDVQTSFRFPILVAPTGAKQKLYEAACAEFRSVFPLALCYEKIVPVDEVVTLMLFHREDGHLCRLMLDDAEKAELDRLWAALMFVSEAPLNEVDALEQIIQFATQDADPKQFEPLREPYRAKAEAFRRIQAEAEPRHVDAVVAFAGRAFRRPLEPREESRIRTLYDTLRQKKLPHDESIRTLVAHVLVAPEFLYKIEAAGPGALPAPVSDYELASRLSYFLWSSMPDEELLAAAKAGRLRDPDVLASEVRRMLAAPASRRLAEEFGTQWLHVHGFAALDEKNAELFPTFADLRADMEEETIRFLDDFFRNDRSILSLIDADHTFLNERLAKHYAIEGVTGEEWRRVEGVRKHGRGSILSLATTLSTQAGASRTSPILRGNWLYETILGEKLPKPPKDVPQLAETVPSGLSERQLIAMHSENAACAKCHRRIDPFGFALEEFDAIGRLRTADASGKPIDTKATLPDGAIIDGQASVRAYLLGPRRDQFVRVFCKKLLGYALGRGVQLSDQPLLDEMAAQLAAHDYRISVAVEAIVKSPQFRSIRGRDAADDAS